MIKRKKFKAVFKNKFGFRGPRRNPRSLFLTICILVSATLVIYIGCQCRFSLQRTVSAGWDFLTSVAFYFCNFYAVVAGKENPVTATVIGVPMTSDNILFPETYEVFLLKLKGFWQTFISVDNLRGFVENISVFVYDLSIILMFALPLVVCLVLLLNLSLDSMNNDVGVVSKPLKFWLNFKEPVIFPVITRISELFGYIKDKRFLKVWIILALLGINAYTFILEGLAFLLYFATSFDFANVYTQIYKLFVDLDIMLSVLPTVVRIVLGWILIVWWRKRRGLSKLRRMELKNCAYVNTFGIATMLTGNMGVGKTKLNTDMILTLESKFKRDAKEIIFRIERFFPFFPWAAVQIDLKKAILHHEIYSLTSAEAYARKKRARFEKNPRDSAIYGYDRRKYGLNYNDELKLWYIFDCLEEYAKAFFVYYLDKSLICGNYSIREDGVRLDAGNMPMWDYDYFDRSPLTEDEVSYYANILDFDVLRKGKQIIKGSRFADTFEFGIVAVTELDKERGNTQDNKELKKASDEANQKNDLFNYSAKMGRHPATIMYKAFVRFMFDQQRAMKTEADMREICDKVINIDSVETGKLAMPLFFAEELLYCLIKPKFEQIYESYRFNRADESLTFYLIKNTLGRFLSWYERTYNRFGYDLCMLVSDSGKLDGSALTSDHYYLLHKKALAHRYSTDCYKGFFRAKSAKKKLGIVDYPTFEGVTATAEELKQMNSYFINDMINKICSEEEANNKNNSKT